ncbi:MAG: GAF domain-containing protein [Smithella sp.]
MNKRNIRILILEDNPTDVELIQFELQEANIDFSSKIVMSKKDFINELSNFSPDIILSDYDLPQYNGSLALAEARKRCPDVPFILVTGAISENRAIDILTGGAKDYVMKSRLNRLAPAIIRALDEAKEHRARKQAEDELRIAHRSLEKQVAEKTADLLRYSQRLQVLSWTAGKLLESDNPQEMVEELCRKVMKFLGCHTFFNYLVDETEGCLHLNAFAGIPEETARTIEWLDYGVAVCGCVARDACRIVAENITEKPDSQTELVKSFGIKAYACHPLIQQNRVLGTLSFGTCSRNTFSEEDLSKMKAVADQVAIAMGRISMEKELRIALKKAVESEQILKALMENVPEGIAIADAPDAKIKMVSRYVQEIIGDIPRGMNAQEVVDIWKVYDKDGITPIKVEELPLSRAISKGETVINEELVQVNTKGRSLPLLCNAAPIRDSSGKIISGIVTWRDISDRKRFEKELVIANQRFDALVSSVRQGILLVSEDSVKLVNQAFCDYFGLADSPQDLVGLSARQVLEKAKKAFLHPEKEVARVRQIVQCGQPVIGEEIAMEGGRTCLRDFIPMYTEGKQLNSLWSHTDITESKSREEQQNRLNRTLRALSNSRQAMMRAYNEQQYMDEVCQIIVEDCDHAMCWIGIAEKDLHKSVRPVACAGVEDGYLKTVNITWADTERGRGPTGTAIRTGKSCMCRNMLKDPFFTPWREDALKRGYASSLVLPLISGDKVFGALNIYSREPDPFIEDEVKLLTELADDLAYGITTIRLRSAHAGTQSALQESEKRYRSLFENMNEGFALHEILCDESGIPYDYRFLDVNPTFEKLTGQNRENIIGRTMKEVLPHEDPLWIERYTKMALSGEPIHFENYSRRLKRYYEVTAYCTAPLRFAVIFRDVTERKQIEKDLTDNTVQLEQSNKELESFSYSVSHDLRAPLRAIDGYSKMILRKQGNNFDEETKRQFNQIRKSAKAMSQLIDDLLAFSRLGQQTMNAKSFNMRNLIEETWQELKNANPDRNMFLTFKTIPSAFGDKALLKQVLVNLFTNAVKFTKNRNIAEIEVGGSKEGNQIIYYIKDNGVGFDMQFRDKLFGVFQRLHNASEYEGTGIGLALVQRVIFRHGGRVWAEGKVNEGATFYFSLPVSPV